MSSSQCEVTALRARSSAAGLLALLSLIACNDLTEHQRTPYAVGAPIPFYNLQLYVQGTGVSSNLDRHSIEVRLHMSGFEGQGQARVASESWQRFFKLVDRDGKKYSCKKLLPADEYYRSGYESERQGSRANPWQRDSWADVPTQWILQFETPLDAQDFTLLIDNMSPHRGDQPEYMSVRLDR